jgi:hypothetical protein
MKFIVLVSLMIIIIWFLNCLNFIIGSALSQLRFSWFYLRSGFNEMWSFLNYFTKSELIFLHTWVIAILLTSKWWIKVCKLSRYLISWCPYIVRSWWLESTWMLWELRFGEWIIWSLLKEAWVEQLLHLGGYDWGIVRVWLNLKINSFWATLVWQIISTWKIWRQSKETELTNLLWVI